MLRKRLKPRPILMQLILIVGSFLMAYPLIFAIVTSFSTQEAYLQSSWMPNPNPLSFITYTQLVQASSKAPQWVLNTIIRVIWYTVLPCIISVLCGYVFARLRFRGRDLVFSIMLISLTVPQIVYALPTYVMMARLPLVGGNNIYGQGGHGIVNEWPAVLVGGLVNVYYIFLMRQSYYSIPRDFEEAGRVDGANTLQVLWHIYVPMLKPALTVIVIFQSVLVWNDYVWPLIAVGGNVEIWPVALGFQRLMLQDPNTNMTLQSTGLGVTNYPWAFTVATIATIPSVLVFLFFQRYFVEGAQGFAIKG